MRGFDLKMAFTIMERVRKGMWLKISEERACLHIQAMRENNVRTGILNLVVNQIHISAHAAAFVMMAPSCSLF